MSENSNNITQKMLGGARRKNGHKHNCSCHICDNMRSKAKRGGYEEDMEKAELKKNGGSKKKNGHKPHCKCPICKNMKMKSKKRRGGDPEPDIENQMGDIEEGRIKSTRENESHTSTQQLPESLPQSSSVVSDDYNELIEAEEGNAGPNKVGGTRRCRNKKMNKRKSRKSRKGGNGEPDIENQMGDIEEAGVKRTNEIVIGPSSNSQPSPEVVDVVHGDYNELSEAEEGNAGPNKVGGKHRKNHKKKSHKMKSRRSKRQTYRRRR
jgi:hypothetical protein